jgi:betaine lipid synthase
MFTFFAVTLPLSLILYMSSPRLLSIWGFVYATFLKPQIDGENSGSDPQAFLDNKYKDQARTYDSTRTFLLPGREAMLGLVAAQLQHRTMNQSQAQWQKPIWVDVSGGQISPC